MEAVIKVGKEVNTASSCPESKQWGLPKRCAGFLFLPKRSTPLLLSTASFSNKSKAFSWRRIAFTPHPAMWILPLVGYAGVLLGFGFLTLAIGMRSIHPQPNLPLFLSGRKTLLTTRKQRRGFTTSPSL